MSNSELEKAGALGNFFFYGSTPCLMNLFLYPNFYIVPISLSQIYEPHKSLRFPLKFPILL